MPKLSGGVPSLYSKECIYQMCRVINSLSHAVDYLSEKVEALESATKLQERKD